MEVRTVRPRMALSMSMYMHVYIYIYMRQCGGPPADGGHPGGRRAGGHPGGRRTGGRYATDGHTCLRYGGREDVEGAPTRRQE
jgi:hypothetical protein